ncbi:hemin-degrading factor [Tropicimonas marinistellae]|uniref:hemin-degrading factor n=1 Tax=Tropicimonas marinistellae TaxID=1739787 RepID=UPI00082CC2C9|nr:ChuX/HutX family heme-like substrate-binding protein [Tropicimonas marinistellae]
MTQTESTSAEEIRAACRENPKARSRDLAEELGLTEAQLVAAHVAQIGYGATRIAAHPDQIIPMITGLGEVMALTRNRSCVIEKVGSYDNYHPGEHAAMTLTPEIDLRMFPSHWVSAFAVEKETETGIRRSIQVFDAAGDAVHKVHLRETSDVTHWQRLVTDLALGDQSTTLTVAPRKPTEAARTNPAKIAELRSEWGRLTDTHQFLRLTSKLKMNRLGAYRVAGAPFVRQLAPEAVNLMLESVQARETEIMIFVGNRGCIEIHGGPIHSLKQMGPWQNVLDPGFNLHLRSDHIAEVWAVDKPTKRGAAISVEAFDADGALIFQVFGRRSDARDFRPDWNDVVADLPPLHAEAAQ